MARPKKVVDEDGGDGSAVDIGDSASKIYRDKAGKSLVGGISEGRSNFGAIIDDARKSILGGDGDSAA